MNNTNLQQKNKTMQASLQVDNAKKNVAITVMISYTSLFKGII